MNDEDLARWARRRHGGAPPAPAPAAAAPPPPPPGYSPPPGYVLVPARPAAPQVQRQPQGAVPYTAQPPPVPNPPPGAPRQMGRVIPFPQGGTNLLVKPGNRDTYAELLGTVPELVPQMAQGDAMAGQISPDVAAEMAPLIAEFPEAASGIYSPHAPVASTRPMSTRASGPELGAVALPPNPDVA